MSLPVPNLDDRSWKQIVDEAVRLIPRYCPECNAPEGLQVEEGQGRVIVTCPGCKRVVEVGIATA